MSLSADRLAFEAAYARRSDQTWAIAPDSVFAQIRAWSPNVLLVAASPEYGGQIEGVLDEVHYRDSLMPWTRPGEPAESLGATYRGVRVTVLHIGLTPGAFGASYMDMGLERLHGGAAQRVVVIGECSSLQEHIRIGDLAPAASAIRDDDSHRAYAPPDVFAAADTFIHQALVQAARATGRAVHPGVCWSCGAGAGIYDPHLAGRALALSQLGVLANTVEAATAYLLGPLAGMRVGSLWLVADGVFEPLTWTCPSPRLGWDQGWKELVWAGLEALVALAREAEP